MQADTEQSPAYARNPKKFETLGFLTNQKPILPLHNLTTKL